jgi:adenylate kinase
MEIVLLGPPGSGKGTQGIRLAGRRAIPHVAAGDLLREAVRVQSPVGMRAQSFMERGELVPDDLVDELIAERLGKEDAARGFVLDGYPRNELQAGALERALTGHGRSLRLVLFLDVPEEEAVRRLGGRRVCTCGATYHVEEKPPEREGICDACGGELTQRKDDNETVIRDRFLVYRRETEPLLRLYGESGVLRKIPGVGAFDEIFEALVQAVEVADA